MKDAHTSCNDIAHYEWLKMKSIWNDSTTFLNPYILYEELKNVVPRMGK